MNKPNKQHLLITSSTYPINGDDARPRFIHDFARRLIDDFDITVLCPSESGISNYQIMDNVKIKRFRYFINRLEKVSGNGAILEHLKANPWSYFLIPFFLIFQLLEVIKYCLFSKSPIINAHWMIPQGVIAVLCKKLLFAKKIRVVVTSHGADMFGLKAFDLLKKWVMKNADKVLVVSEPMREFCINFLGEAYNENIIVRSMGIDYEKVFYPSCNLSRNRKILFVGRLAKKKGVDVLISALGILKARGVFASCTIVGDGLERVWLEKLVKELDLSGYVTFLGAMNHSMLSGIMREHAIFVFPSVVALGGDKEGLGLTALEAMGCECLVIASDLDTTRDFIVHGETGLLFEPNNCSELSKRIEYALDNEDKFIKIRKEARIAAMKKYSWEVVINHYRSIFQSLLLD